VRRRRSVPRSRIDPRERLLEAAYRGDLAAARRALAGGASANFRARSGTTPLYAAAVQGNGPMVRLLLEAGADPDRQATGDTEGTPLCAAASWDHAEAVQALPEAGPIQTSKNTTRSGPGDRCTGPLRRTTSVPPICCSTAGPIQTSQTPAARHRWTSRGAPTMSASRRFFAERPHQAAEPAHCGTAPSLPRWTNTGRLKIHAVAPELSHPPAQPKDPHTGDRHVAQHPRAEQHGEQTDHPQGAQTTRSSPEAPRLHDR